MSVPNRFRGPMVPANEKQSSADNRAVPAMPLRKRVGRWGIAVVAAGILAIVTAFGTGLGSKAADSLSSSDNPPLSYSAEEKGGECGSVLFLPEDQSQRALDEKPPYSLSEWEEFQHQPGSAYVGRDVVEVAIQGESARTVTLTGISFEVERLRPEQGATFAAPCGDGTYGRALVVDLDSVPPDIVASSREVGAPVAIDADGHSVSRPIKFPWTVSLVDSLLLYVVATTDSCFCTWKAQIPWVSGSDRGVISIDSDGSGYRVFADPSFDNYVTDGSSWNPS